MYRVGITLALARNLGSKERCKSEKGEKGFKESSMFSQEILDYQRSWLFLCIINLITFKTCFKQTHYTMIKNIDNIV